MLHAITWDEGPNAKVNSRDIWEELRAASKKDGVVAKTVGDVARGLSQGETGSRPSTSFRSSPMRRWSR